MDVVERVDGVCGELVLRTDGTHYEVIANGTFLMDTRAGASERLLVTAAADVARAGARVLVGGLGVGFSLRAALDHPRVGEVVVVEREPAVIRWNRGVLRGVHGDALSAPSVRVVCADLLAYLGSGELFDVICLDVDNGPLWTVDDGNARLYGAAGLGLVGGALREGGVVGVWSSHAVPEFGDALGERFGGVRVLEVAVGRGVPDVVYVAGGWGVGF